MTENIDVNISTDVLKMRRELFVFINITSHIEPLTIDVMLNIKLIVFLDLLIRIR